MLKFVSDWDNLGYSRKNWKGNRYNNFWVPSLTQARRTYTFTKRRHDWIGLGVRSGAWTREHFERILNHFSLVSLQKPDFSRGRVFIFPMRVSIFSKIPPTSLPQCCRRKSNEITLIRLQKVIRTRNQVFEAKVQARMELLGNCSRLDFWWLFGYHQNNKHK